MPMLLESESQQPQTDETVGAGATIERFVEAVQGLDDVSSFEHTIGSYLRGLGFDRFAYLALRIPENPKAPFVVTTYPDEWAQHYGENDYVNSDPVLERAARTLRAFDWPTLSRMSHVTTRQKQVLTEARDFGVGRGATVPIHSPGGGFATLSIASSESDREFQNIWRAHWPTLHLLALYTHSALETNLLSPEPLPPVYLTDRERECLLWTARGKTAGDISGILSISQETVVFHLKNAMQKVGVYSKHHAVVKAIMMGLIHP